MILYVFECALLVKARQPFPELGAWKANTVVVAAFDTVNEKTSQPLNGKPASSVVPFSVFNICSDLVRLVGLDTAVSKTHRVLIEVNNC